MQRFVCFWLLSLLLLGCSQKPAASGPGGPAAPAAGQNPASAPPAASALAFSSLLVPDQFAALRVNVRGVMQSKLLGAMSPELRRNMLREIAQLSRSGELEEIAEDENKIEEFWLIFGPPGIDSGLPPALTLIAEFASPAEAEATTHLAELVERGLVKPYEQAGERYYVAVDGSRAIWMVSDRVACSHVGGEAASVMRRMIDARQHPQPTELARQLQSLDAQAPIMAAGSVAPVRDLLSHWAAELGPLLASVPKNTQSAAIAINLDGPTLLSAKIHAVDPEIAAAFQALSKTLVEAGSQRIAEAREETQSSPDPTAAVDLLDIAAEGVKSLRAETQGATLTLTMPRPPSLKIWPSIVAALEKHQQRLVHINRGRQLALAIEQARAVRGKLPEDIADGQGKRLLSWRAALVPFLEQASDASELKFDEPWDSQHNQQAASSGAPELFQTPSADGPTMTTWKWVGGAPGEILIIDAGKGKSTLWTQPEDFQLSADDPLSSLGKEPEGGYVVVLKDGSVLQLKGAELVERLKIEQSVEELLQPK